MASTHGGRVCRLAVLAAALCLALPGAAAAADVTSGLDTNVDGTLRYEVVTGAGPFGDTVDIDPAVRTIAIDSANPAISVDGKLNLTILGDTDSNGNPLTTITGGLTPRTTSVFSGDHTGNGLTLRNLIFDSIQATNLAGVYGAIVGIGTGSTAGVSIGDLVNTRFTNNSAAWRDNVHGGGLVGARSASGAATVGAIGSGVTFSGNTVSADSASYNGGGLVGAQAGGLATVGNIEAGVSFSGNTVSTGSGSYNGGGLVGAQAGGTATVGNIEAGVSFTGNTVSTGSGSYYGGGLVGASSQGSSAVGDIAVNVSFSGNTISTGRMFFQGGGLVGAWSNVGTATVGVANGIGGQYVGNSIETGGGSVESYISGGGLVGASSGTGAGSARVGDIRSGSAFGGSGENEGNTVTSSYYLYGGGLVGARSIGGSATVGAIGSGVSFTRNTVSAERDSLEGGGLVGARSTNGTATVGAIGSGVSFAGNAVSAYNSLQGGGLVGAWSNSGTAMVGDIWPGASFSGNTISTISSITGMGNLLGGGLVGARSNSGTATVGNIGSGASFSGNAVSAYASLQGGGLVGARSGSDMAKIGAVAGSFSDNTVTVGAYLAGGGILGAYAFDVGVGKAALGNLAGASFTGNRVEVGAKANAGEAWAMGGVIGASGLDAAWAITGAAITGNTLAVYNHNPAVTAGTIFIGTEGSTAHAVNGNPTHAVTVDGDTDISGNTIAYSGGETRRNSFHFGRGWNASNNVLHGSAADASLTLAPGAGDTVALLDPVSVDMNNGKEFNFLVRAADNTGTVKLGGKSMLDAAGGSTFTAESGALVLAADFSLTKEPAALDGSANNGALDVVLDNGSGELSLVFELDGRKQDLAMFAAPDSFSVAGAPDTAVSVSVSGNTFAPQAVSGRWLVTDQRDNVNETDFNLTASAGSDLILEIEGASLYITGTAAQAPDSVSHSASPNVLASFRTGALHQAWLAAKNELNLSPAGESVLFDRIAANPERLTAEAFASRAVAALDSAAGMWTGVRGIADLSAPGGWQRDDPPVASASSGSGSGISSGSALASSVSSFRRGLATWAGAFASRSDQDPRGGLYGYDGRFYGGAVGGTYVFNQSWRSGLYFAYGRDKTEFDSLGAEIEADAWQAGGFAETRPTSRWGLRADLSHTWFDNKLNHRTPVGRYRSDFDQRVFALGLESGYDFRPGDGLTRLTPFAGLRWQHLSQERGVEKAQAGAPAAFASRLASLSADSLIGSLGLELAREFRLSGGRRLLPALRAAWTHEFGDARIRGVGGYAADGPSYHILSLKRARDAVDLSAQLAARLREAPAGNLDLTAALDATLARHYIGYGFRMGIRLEF